MSSSDGGPGDETATKMVRTILPDGDIREIYPAESGTHDIWFVTIQTTDGPREYVLKAQGNTPEAMARARKVGVEPRLLALLLSRTDIPVPAVAGRVDDHEELPAPFFLMEHLHGRQLESGPVTVGVNQLEAILRDVGGYLGQLHTVRAFDAFGAITTDQKSDTLDGTRPLARQFDLRIDTPEQSWRTVIESVAQGNLNRLAETRFSDLVPRIRTALNDGIDALDESSTSVIGQFDHRYENLLLDPDSASVVGMIDWEMGIEAVPSVWHLVWAEYDYSQPAILDKRKQKRVQAALYDGYRSTNALNRTERFEHRRLLYLILREVIALNQFMHIQGDEDAHRALLGDLLSEWEQ